jgi:glyceraldehyde-3-phosphate dehydrogenase/erythrose-4-phosphate dehydrogenase
MACGIGSNGCGRTGRMALRWALELPEAEVVAVNDLMEVSDDEVVSVDIVGNPHSAIIDAPSTRVLKGTTAKVLSWYDNEWGYSCRLAGLACRLV